MSRPYRSAPAPAEFLAARKRHGLTIAQAAAVLDVVPATWRNWESGKHSGMRWCLTSFDYAVQLARQTGVLPSHCEAWTAPAPVPA